MKRGWDGFSALNPKAPGVGFVSHTETSPTLDFHDEFVAEWRQRRLVEGFTPFVVLNINHYVIEHYLFLKLIWPNAQAKPPARLRRAGRLERLVGHWFA